MKRIIIVVLIFLSVFAVNAQSVDYLGKAKKYYAEGNCKGAKAYLDLYVELGGAVDKAVRDFSAEVDRCLEGKDKTGSEEVECMVSRKTVLVHGGHEYVVSWETVVVHGGHECVDLGLSVKWATCNVGANKPEEYGDYFAWGETTEKGTYYKDNCPTYGLTKSELQSQGYIDSEGNLTPKYDAARANWGGNWRMPTKTEMQELKDRCTWTWTTQNGVNGYKVKGPNGNSIFLPAAGCRHDGWFINVGSRGFYWSSTPRESGSNSAYYLYFDSSHHRVNDYYRYYGLSVRPVLE